MDKNYNRLLFIVRGKKHKGEFNMTKTTKRLLALALIFSFLLMVGGCTVVQSQKMRVVKGTYKLTSYTYTPSYERKEGYTPKTRNYIEDEEYKFEDYLVVTGEGRGYYVHKQAGAEVYIKEVTLSYEYDTEDSSKVSYVTYNDSISVNATSGINRLGVTKDSLNYSLSAIDYTEWFTKRPMRSEAISVRWDKVSSKTDLSYVERELGEIKKYEYSAFGVRGVYQLTSTINAETSDLIEDNYEYFYYLIDPVQNAYSATIYYALKETPETMVVKNVMLVKGGEDWNIITIDGITLTADHFSDSYYSEVDGYKKTFSLVSNDISQSTIEWLISQA